MFNIQFAKSTLKPQTISIWNINFNSTSQVMDLFAAGFSSIEPVEEVKIPWHASLNEHKTVGIAIFFSLIHTQGSGIPGLIHI